MEVLRKNDAEMVDFRLPRLITRTLPVIRGILPIFMVGLSSSAWMYMDENCNHQEVDLLTQIYEGQYPVSHNGLKNTW